jgi:hypothetical protein
MDVRERVAGIMAVWYAGRANYSEIEQRLTDIVSVDTVDELMACLPPEWRSNMLESFREYRNVRHETELISVFGGIMEWELEKRSCTSRMAQAGGPGA